MNWSYQQPVEIVFGYGVLDQLPQHLSGYQKPLLVCTKRWLENETVKKIRKEWHAAVYFDISNNPEVSEVNRCTEIIRERECDVIIAIGGGSTMDLAKAASVASEDIRKYWGTGILLPDVHIPVIAVPTTAGTGSEVTSVSVLSDRSTKRKIPLSGDSLYPQKALIDPALLQSLPPAVTASTGIDVLCHALEGYWSRNHQPISDALAVYAIRTILTYLPAAYLHPDDRLAREKTAEASLIAGLAFNLPKTTAAHACSFPLTSIYGIPHGEACGMTIDFFLRINEADKRTRELAALLGYSGVEELAQIIGNLKKVLHLRLGLGEFELNPKDMENLIRQSHHPNLNLNPIPVTDEMLREMYRELSCITG
ncbi:MAG: iron-containing alcohol dehydrogenase family protein [Eubacteriales bacterium]|nr:iron-containing alcohol dehydrogenase family protein [Eubacteriales bacterium]